MLALNKSPKNEIQVKPHNLFYFKLYKGKKVIFYHVTYFTLIIKLIVKKNMQS
jgi:hypothetical protein